MKITQLLVLILCIASVIQLEQKIQSNLSLFIRNLKNKREQKQQVKNNGNINNQQDNDNLQVDNQIQLENVQLRTPIQDDREFFQQKLDNKLNFLYIQDKELKTSHVSLAVQVGSYQDPLEYQGLAHLLEHMLFMGSQKYPSIQEFTNCISLYQGSSNAQTESEFTTFYFDISNQGLYQCLDVFAQFFIAPLFDESSVEKELEAVESEFQNQLANQQMGEYFALKLLCNKEHPFSRFSCGNKSTLDKQNVVQQLKEFHQKYYSANLMNLVIISNKEPSEMASNVNQMFKAIKNIDVDKKSLCTTHKVFPNKSQTIRLKSKEMTKQIIILYELPSNRQHYTEKSLEIIMEFFVNNGEQSLRRYLKDNNFILSMQVSTVESNEQFQLVQFEYELTQKGYTNKQKILSLHFQYLKNIKQMNTSTLQNIYDQQKIIQQQMFNVSDKFEDIVFISQSRAIYDMQDIFYHSYHYGKMDEHQIRKYLELMTPEKAQIIISNNEFNFKKLIEIRSHDYFDELYQIYYLLSENEKGYINNEDTQQSFKIDEDMLKYVPTNITKIIQKPIVAYENESFKLWYIQYDQSKLPEDSFNLQFYSPYTKQNAQQLVMLYLIQHILDDVLVDKFYNAIDTNLYVINVKVGYEGISMSFQGNSQYLQQLTYDFLEQIQYGAKALIKNDLVKFRDIKQHLQQKLMNNIKSECYQQIRNKFNAVLYKYWYDERSLLQALQLVELESLEQYWHQFFQNIYIEGFITGVITKENAIGMVKQIEKILKMNQKKVKKQLISQEITKLNQSQQQQPIEFYYKNENELDDNNCVYVYNQYQQIYDLRAATIFELLMNIIDQNAFESLRTQKQLGYIASANMLELNKVYGMGIIVQGNKYDHEYIKQQIITFYGKIPSILKQISQTQFDKIKLSLKEQLQEKVSNLEQFTNMFYNHILTRDYRFDEHDMILQMIQEITLKEVQLFFEKFLQTQQLFMIVQQQKSLQNDELINNQDLLLIKQHTFGPSKVFEAVGESRQLALANKLRFLQLQRNKQRRD